MTVAVMLVQTVALGTSPLAPPPTPPEKCIDHPKVSSHAEAESRAVSEVERKWIKLEKGHFKVEASRVGCDWWVMIRLLPLREGGHFGVFIRGASGEIEWSAKIDA